LLKAVDNPEVCSGARDFGTVPDVEGVGDDGTVLAGEGDNDKEGPVATQVLALGALIFVTGTTTGVVAGADVGLTAGLSLAWTVEG